MTDSSLPPQLRLFLRVTVLLGLLCLFAELICAFVLHLDGIYTWPTLPYYDCVDFRCFQLRFEHFHQLDFFSTNPDLGPPFGYPAPGALLYQAFYLFSWHPRVLFFVVTLGGIAWLLTLLTRAMMAYGVGGRRIALLLTLSIVFSYPLWFEFLLGNMEICIVLIVAVGVLLFLRERSYAAAACFAFAGSVKLFPLIYLGLLLSRKQYRQFFFGLLLVVPITLLSLWLVCPSIPVAWHGVQTGLAAFRRDYLLMLRPAESGFDHSLFGWMKQTIAFTSTRQITLALDIYPWIAALGGTLLYFLRIRFLPVANQVLALAVASILLPPISNDYTLLHLYLPWSLLILLALRARQAGTRVPGLTAAFLAFALLFAPLTELIYAGQTYSGILKSMVLSGLLYLSVRYPFEQQARQRPAAAPALS